MAFRKAAPPAVEGVNFGDDSMYSGGLGLPEGDYALEFFTQMFQPTKRDGSATGDSFLAVMLNAYPLAGGDPIEHAINMGRNAKESFVPTPDGKGIAAIPGTAGTFSDQSNWGIFRKSMIDCGLPKGVLTNSFTTIDGIHVHIQNIPEPEGRKEMRERNRGKTGEAAGDQKADDRVRFISVVTEIKEDGKPWEGTGGLPDGTEAPASPAPKVAPKAAAKPGPRAVAPVATEPAAADEADIEQAALAGITAVLSVPANANGIVKLKLRTGTFTAVKTAAGDDMAQAVQDTYMNDDKALKGLLGQLGYALNGQQVVPQS
jgi:hypothetical protein